MFVLIRWILRRRREAAGGLNVRVETYKSDRDAEHGIEKMLGKGYHVQGHATRKARYSAAAGIFTRKQIHTVTYVR